MKNICILTYMYMYMYMSMCMCMCMYMCMYIDRSIYVIKMSPGEAEIWKYLRQVSAGSGPVPGGERVPHPSAERAQAPRAFLF